MDDDVIIDMIRDRDPDRRKEGTAALYGKYWERLARCHKRFGEDAASKAIMDVAERIRVMDDARAEQLKRGGGLRRYVHRSFRNALTDQFRLEDRPFRDEARLRRDNPEPDPADAAEGRDMFARFREQLNDEDLLIWDEFLTDQPLNVAHLAEELGRSERWVYVRAQSLRERFRDFWERNGGDYDA